MYRGNKKKLQLLRANSLTSVIQGRIGNAGITFGDKLKTHWLAKTATVCLFLTYGLQIIDLLMARDDYERLFECFSVIFFCGMGILKLVSLRSNHKRWNHLLSTATELEEEQLVVKTTTDDNDGSTEFLEHIQFYTKNFQTTSIVLSRMYILTAVVYILTPFIEYTLKKLNGAEISAWIHVLPCWTPLDNFSVIGYLATIFLETIAALYCVFIHLTFDLTSVGLMIFVCGQFRLIRDYSEKIGCEKENYILYSKKSDDRVHLRIIRCHKIHVMLTSSIEKLRELLKDILGVYFFLATLTLCSVAVRVNSDISAIQLASLLQYMCATLTQLFLFCYYGDNILNKSSVGMGQGPFGAAHWSLSPSLKKELMMLGMGMSRPCRLYAGPFISVNLSSFLQIIRTAYSYYAVIQKNE